MTLKFQENVLLKKHTTFAIGGPADWFCEAKTEKEIVSAIKWAKKRNLPYFILGGGSNILVSDKGYRGLVIKVKNDGFAVKNTRIFAKAGTPLSTLVKAAVENSLAGLELAVCIPGTLGGAIFGNAGTTDWGVAKQVEKVTLLMPDGKIKEVDQKWLEPGYRQTRIKRLPSLSRPIILSAVLKLRKGNRSELEKIIAERQKVRAERYPLGPSAGCVFKNPKQQSAGFLIDQVGLRGKRIGGAKISEIHANFIINDKGASATDVLRLIKIAKKKVKEKFGIKFQEEIELVGF